jgi:hypothetical protein
MTAQNQPIFSQQVKRISVNDRFCQENSRITLNPQLPIRDSQPFVRYAVMARAGTGPGFHGSGIKGAIRTILSDPQRPHRCRAEDETIVQFSQ